MDTLPMFPPPKPPELRGTCEVNSKTTDNTYTVDLDEMVCDCQHGAAWRWNKRKWVPNSLCSHKLKAVASLLQQNPDNDKLREFYEESIGNRFNAFESVSAMHKELRRADVEKALYWASVIIPHRGRHGVVQYCRRISFEETRDINLYRYATKVSTKGTSVSTLEMQRVVARFCAAPKKWELPWRREIYLGEMQGYRRLVKEFGPAVAGNNAIEAPLQPKMREAMLEGFATGDRTLLQYGLKGWYKCKNDNFDHMKVDMLNDLIDVADGTHPNKFSYSEAWVDDLHSAIMAKFRQFGDIRYHELNALADALTGEDGHDPRATLKMAAHKRIVNNPKTYHLPLGELRKVPLYAQDNHTWAGKAKMRSYRAQLDPGAKQTDLDFRMCGAYMGVGWRTLAMHQHGTIDCKWGDVKWEPKWLWQHLDNMFY